MCLATETGGNSQSENSNTSLLHAGRSRAVVQQDTVKAKACHVLHDFALRIAVEPNTCLATRADAPCFVQQYQR